MPRTPTSFHPVAAVNGGSPYSGGVSFLFADGSVHPLAHELDEAIFDRLRSPVANKEPPLGWLEKVSATTEGLVAGGASTKAEDSGLESTEP